MSRLRRTVRRARGRLSKVVRIARWEVAHAAGALDRRTVLVGVAVLLLAGSVVGAGLAAGVGGVAIDRDVYRVGVAPDSPYAAAVDAEPALAHGPHDRSALGDEVDIVVYDSADAVTVLASDTAKGEAAAATFRDAVESHNERLMAAEENASAAFPVSVTLQYVSRTGGVTEETTLDGGEETDADDGSDEGETAADDDGDGGLGTGDLDTGDDDGIAVPSIGGGSAFGADAVGSPGSISPPFPFVSLVLAFAFLVPFNFLIQAYGSSILNERVNRRGELLLVAPVRPVEIVAGKTLPYLAGALVTTAAIALAVGGGVVSVAAVVPIALAFLAATFVGAMFARSFKELTFVTVTVSVFLTTYAFVPAIFTNVTPIALISPLTLVVFDLQGEAVSAGDYLFSTGPFYVAAGLLFLLGAGVYREEDMFTQKSVPAKFLDALAVRMRAVDGIGPGVRGVPWRSLAVVALITACTIPFVFVVELLAVAVLFALPVAVSIPVLLLTIALVEEVAKSVHLYAGFETGLFERSEVVAVAVGIASGTGFFLAEKATAVVQVVGLTELYVGRAAFGPAVGGSPIVAVGLFLAPLALHAFVTALAAVGASRSRRWYLVLLAAATVIHAGYNGAVVSIYG